MKPVSADQISEHRGVEADVSLRDSGEFGDIRVRDIGVMGLASHDMFTWDRKTATNLENGRLDLSTIFDYADGARWTKGGNPKNSENAPVYSVTMALVDHYRETRDTYQATLLDQEPRLSRREIQNRAHVFARQSTVQKFHGEVQESFERLTRREFPQQRLNEPVTNVEQAAMRGLHDILPGRIQLFRDAGPDELVVTNPRTTKTRLNEVELSQVVRDYDGAYDPEYLRIEILSGLIVVNLQEADAEFIQNFGGGSQSEMLADLAQVGRGEKQLAEVAFTQSLETLFAKGMCAEGNSWMTP